MPNKTDNDSLLKELFDLYFGHLVIFSKRIVKSSAVAEDVVQEVFLNLWKNERLESCSPQFLYRCVRNASINYIKSGRLRYSSVSEMLLVSVADDSNSIDEEVEKMQQLESLYQAIEKLPPQCREVLKEVYLKKQKYADVAVQMNISLNTVRAHMYNAVKLLREYLVLLYCLFILR
ncbi:MAG: sigma-70 family RNA polymerase sigma factor [Bacteroidales bacterium]